MVTTTTLQRIRQAVEAVPDPELPPVTIGMLGMVADVRDEDGTVVVELLPTFSGCPATQMIGEDVAAAVRRAGAEDVDVRWLRRPVWTSDRITAEGREALTGFGIAPPGPRPLLPVVADAPPVACPMCGSTDTVADSPFGPTPCRAAHYCRACRQPFEAFKPL